jgi:hypothetical protein
VPPLAAPLFALCLLLAASGDPPVGWLVALVAGALAPDADLLLLLVSPASAVKLHRGPTHGVVGLVVAAGGAGVLAHLLGGPSWVVSIGFAAAGTAVHAAWDVLSIQGLALPGRKTAGRTSVPVLVALDPYVTVLLSLGVLGAVGFPAGARVIAGAAVVLYLVILRFVLRRRAWDAAREALATPLEGVYPRPESPGRWTVVTRTLEGLQVGVLDLGTRRLSLLEAPPDAGTSPALASLLGQAFVERAVFPVARVEGKTVRLRDLRFAYDWPAPPFGVDIDLDAEGRPVRERAYL